MTSLLLLLYTILHYLIIVIDSYRYQILALPRQSRQQLLYDVVLYFVFIIIITIIIICDNK